MYSNSVLLVYTSIGLPGPQHVYAAAVAVLVACAFLKPDSYGLERQKRTLKSHHEIHENAAWQIFVHFDNILMGRGG